MVDGKRETRHHSALVLYVLCSRINFHGLRRKLVLIYNELCRLLCIHLFPD